MTAAGYTRSSEAIYAELSAGTNGCPAGQEITEFDQCISAAIQLGHDTTKKFIQDYASARPDIAVGRTPKDTFCTIHAVLQIVELANPSPTQFAKCLQCMQAEL